MAKLRIASLMRSRKVKTPVTKQAVKDIVRGVQELKCFTPNATTGQTTVVAGTLHRLSDISQGDDISNRSGDVISMQHLRMRFNFFDTNATARSGTVRVIIFTDSMGSGASVGITEVVNQANHLSPISGINIQRHRFKVLHDEMFSVVSATNYQERPHTLLLKVGQKRYYNDASATATNTGKNALYMLVFGSTVNMTYDFAFQLRYTDS